MGVDFYPPLGLIRVHRVDPKMPKQRGLLESPLTPALSPLEQGGRGYGSGGILQKAASVRRTRVAGVYPYQKPRRRRDFSNTLPTP